MDDDVGRLRLIQNPFERAVAGVVAAVAHDDEHLTFVPPPGQIRLPGIDRVVKRGAPPRGDGVGQGLAKHGGIAGERHVGRKRPLYRVVERQREDLVPRVAVFDKGRGRGQNEAAVTLHAAAVVDE